MTLLRSLRSPCCGNWNPGPRQLAIRGKRTPGRWLAPSIYRIRRIAAFEDGGEVVHRHAAHGEARGARGAADVRREDDVGQRGIERVQRRLALEDVEAGAGDAAMGEREGERRVVHHAAARAVHE